MSASNKKIWLVVLISAVVGLGLAIYLVRMVGESADRRVITKQAREWGEIWAQTRSCLVGANPSVQSAGYAYLMYEATHTKERRRLAPCNAFLRKLRRPGKEASGDAKVEKSWDNVKKATKKLTNAYALAVDTSSMRPTAERRKRMAAALDGMDAAYAKLLSDSKMDPAPPPGDAEVRQLSEGILVADGDRPIPPDNADLFGDTLLVQGNIDDVATLAIVNGPEKISVQGIATALRAADDASWGVFLKTTDGQLGEMRAGPLDDKGNAEGDGIVVLTGKNPEQVLGPRFALGRGDLRAILFEIYDGVTPDGPAPQSIGLHMVRSTDGGKSWSKPALLASNTGFSWTDFGRRRYDLAWSDAQNAMRWLTINAAGLDKPPRPKRLFDVDGSVGSLDQCLGENASWWLRDRSSLYHVAGDGRAARPVDDLGEVESLTRCSDSRALLLSYVDAAVAVSSCDGQRCKPLMQVPLAAGSRDSTGLGAKSGAFVVTQTNDLLLLWPESGEAPRAFKSQGEHDLHSVVEWDGELYAVMKSDAEIRLVHLPGS